MWRKRPVDVISVPTIHRAAAERRTRRAAAARDRGAMRLGADDAVAPATAPEPAKRVVHDFAE